jgi:hypothetical protein
MCHNRYNWALKKHACVVIHEKNLPPERRSWQTTDSSLIIVLEYGRRMPKKLAFRQRLSRCRRQ